MVTTGTVIVPGFGMFVVLSAEGRLGARLARDTVLLGIQLVLPLLWFFDDLLHATHCKGQAAREPFALWMHLTMLKS